MLEAYHRVGFDEETIDRYVIHGPTEACLERLAEYAEAGARTIVLVPASADHPGQIRRVARELLPHCAVDPAPTRGSGVA
jgi:alkanesulfonate monooxygenase SsuD/methylene tetrahydromethanopterin reductase-like flavin-dependent oxidoreductase (luciferase family)